jgi:hypothetical protein
MARTYEQDKVDVNVAVQTILDALNGGNQKDLAAVVYDTVSREHRTLQQCFWSMMLQAQIKYADNSSDLRNEASVKLANVVKAAATANNFDMGLPYC